MAIDALVCELLPNVLLWFAVDANDCPLAFMFICDGHMEALFVDPVAHGSGIGTALVHHGLSLNANMTTDVNEQNLQALSFYKNMGFRSIGRSPVDGQGRPYPIVHLKHIER